MMKKTKLIHTKTFKATYAEPNEDGQFTGYASIFGVKDEVGDIVDPGAFKKSLQEKKRFPFLWQHFSFEPIGWVELEEDEKGLRIVKGQLILDTQRGKEARALIKEGAIQGISFGYEVMQEEKQEDGNHLKEIKLWEVSAVTFPAQKLAGVDAIKSVEIDDGEPPEVKKVIPYQDFGNAPEDEEWDAGKEVREADVETLKKICAWYDAENPDIKTSYKLPHHKASNLKAVWRGVAAAMGALLGARGGVDIPDNDRQGVYNHLKKHYQDFEKEPPEFRSMPEPEKTTQDNLSSEPADSHSEGDVKAENKADKNKENEKMENEKLTKEILDSINPKIEVLEKEVLNLKAMGIGAGGGSESQEDKEYKKAFWDYVTKGIEPPSKKAADMNLTTGTQGGYLIPPDFYAKIIEYLIQFSPIRSYATILPTSAYETLIPKEGKGIDCYWPGETGARTPNDFTGAFGQVPLKQYPHTALVKISRQMLNSTAIFDLTNFLSGLVARSIAASEGTKFVSGSGTNCPTGLLNGSLLTRVETEVASTLAADDLISLFFAVPEPYRSRGVWLMNDAILATISKMKAATTGEYLLGTLAGRPGFQILGRPVISAPDLAAAVANNAEVAIFGDLSGYFISENPAVTMLRLDELYAANGQVGFLFEFLTGGYPVDAQGLRVLKVKSGT